MATELDGKPMRPNRVNSSDGLDRLVGPSGPSEFNSALGLQRPLYLGLTGGIASGKSTLAQLLVEHTDVGLVDADAISRSLTAPGGAALEAIAQAFGREALHPETGLNRPLMRERVFNDAAAKAQLEAILHPLIQEACWTRAAHYCAQEPRPSLVLFDIPLLYESRAYWRRRLDRILVVDCRQETQLERLLARSGLEKELAQRMIAAQSTREQRRSIADIVVHNEGLDKGALSRLVQCLAQALPGPHKQGASLVL